MLFKILSLLFPPTEYEKTVNSCVSLTPSPHTHTSSRGTKILTCANYNETCTQAVIKVLKKYGSEKSASLLANLLSDTLTEEIATLQLWNTKKIILVPIPLTPKRKRERGFNQMEIVFNHLPKHLKELVNLTVLKRTKHSKEQKSLSREERLKNLNGAFRVADPSEIQNTHVILVDDVTATGATLYEASRALTRAGAQVTAIALARA